MSTTKTLVTALALLVAACEGGGPISSDRDAHASGPDGGAGGRDAEAGPDGATSEDGGGLTDGGGATDGGTRDTDAGGEPGDTAYEPYTCTRTLAAGGDVQAFVGSLAAGDVGCLEAGTYSAGALEIDVSGITLASVPGGRARIELDYAYVWGDDVALLRLDLVTSEIHTMRIFGDRALVQQCSLTNGNASGAGACIGVGGSSGVPDGVVLQGNRFYDCGDNDTNLNHAIYANSYTNLTIVDNVFSGTGAYNIQLYPDAHGTIVRHNVVDGSNEFSIRGSLIVDGDSTNHTIEQNIFAYAAVTAVEIRTGSGHTVANNCFWQNEGGDVSGVSASGSVNTDPRFIDRGERDYRLASDTGCLAVVGYDTAAKITRGW